MNQGKNLIGSSVKVGIYRVTIQKKIGEGGYAVVYLAVDSQKTQYALKIVRCVISEKFAQFKNEAYFLQSLPAHPNIVQLFGYEIDESSMMISFLFEYCPQTAIGILTKRSLSKEEILIMFNSICKATAFLHSSTPPIIHRDLKPENILISKTGVPKLCDFGSATKKSYQEIPLEQIPYIQDEIDQNTTPNYRSPEMIDLYRQMPIGIASDVWALGCTLFKLINKNDAFLPEDRLSILQCKYTLGPDADENFTYIMRACLQFNPLDRPNASQLVAYTQPLIGNNERLNLIESNTTNDDQPDQEWGWISSMKESYRYWKSSGVEKLIVKATYASDQPPKTKHIRKILISALYNQETNPMNVITQLLDQRPWNKDSRVAAKSLYLILLITQYQTNLSDFVPITVRSDAVLSHYAKAKVSEGYRGSHTSIKNIGLTIRIKLMLHAAHPDLEGNLYSSQQTNPHLSNDLIGYIKSLTQAASEMITEFTKHDSFSVLVMSRPIIQELSNSVALIVALNPEQDVSESQNVLERAKGLPYLQSSVKFYSRGVAPKKRIP